MKEQKAIQASPVRREDVVNGDSSSISRKLIFRERESCNYIIFLPALKPLKTSDQYYLERGAKKGEQEQKARIFLMRSVWIGMKQ